MTSSVQLEVTNKAIYQTVLANQTACFITSQSRLCRTQRHGIQIPTFECTKRSRLHGTHRWCQDSHLYPLSHAGNHKQGAMHGSPVAQANPKSGSPPFGHQHNTALHQLVHTVSTIMHGLPLRSSISWSFRAITVGRAG